MSLSEELNQLSNSAGCATCVWYAERTAQEQASFDANLELIRAKRGRYVDLWSVCTRYGLDTTARKFRYHCHEHVEATE